MKDLSRSENYMNLPNLADYQHQLALSLQEIKGAINILETSEKHRDNELDLSHKLDLTNEILDQVNQRLKGLEEFYQGEISAA